MPNETLVKIAHNMKRYRKENNFTQSQLAQKAKMHHSYISKIENAKINIFLSTLLKLAKALKITPKDLVK